MQKSIEVTGRTEDDAIRAALEQLGLSRDDVSVEIIEQAKTGFLGFKSSPAVVRVMYEAKEEKTERAEDFLRGLLVRMDIEADMTVTEEEGAVNVILSGREPGALIGRRGETLDAIQHLTNYAVNRGSESRVRINIDAENYRQRRNETLESLAARVAGKAVKYRRNMTLDPMNAYERHVIHTALQENDRVSTYSVGSEPNRRVVVAYGKRGEGRQNQQNRYNRQGRQGQGEGRQGQGEGRQGQGEGWQGQGEGWQGQSAGQQEQSQPGQGQNAGGGTQYREWR